MNCPICGSFLNMTHLAKELDVQAEKANKRFWQRVWLVLALVVVGVGVAYWNQPQQDEVVYRVGELGETTFFSITMPPNPLQRQALPIDGKCKRGAFVVNGGCWVPVREPPHKGECPFDLYYAIDPKTGSPTCWIPIMKDDRMPVASPPED